MYLISGFLVEVDKRIKIRRLLTLQLGFCVCFELRRLRLAAGSKYMNWCLHTARGRQFWFCCCSIQPVGARRLRIEHHRAFQRGFFFRKSTTTALRRARCKNIRSQCYSSFLMSLQLSALAVRRILQVFTTRNLVLIPPGLLVHSSVSCCSGFKRGTGKVHSDSDIPKQASTDDESEL